MKLKDINLQDALMSLSGRDREALEAHMRGQASAAGLQILQTIKAKLKRKARVTAGKRRKNATTASQTQERAAMRDLRKERSKAAAIERAQKRRAITPAEREAARRDYIQYAARNRAAHIQPEPFERYLVEWLDTRRAEAIEGAQGDEADRYERRDYGVIYRGGDRWVS
jgi:hypothetical protein